MVPAVAETAFSTLELSECKIILYKDEDYLYPPGPLWGDRVTRPARLNNAGYGPPALDVRALLALTLAKGKRDGD